MSPTSESYDSRWAGTNDVRCSIYGNKRSTFAFQTTPDGSAVVASLIVVAPPKSVKTADLRGGTAEPFNMLKTSEVPPLVGPIRSGVAAAPP